MDDKTLIIMLKSTIDKLKDRGRLHIKNIELLENRQDEIELFVVKLSNQHDVFKKKILELELILRENG